MRSFRALVLALAVVALAACGTTLPELAPASPETMKHVPHVEGWQAGVARVDITPPLHLALWAHGPESRIAAGFRLRLRCQTFVVASGAEVVALVPCDLGAPSLALHRRVADHLAAKGIPIPPQRLFLMATHTHAGPAHYFEARRYSGSFSSMAPGYDEKVLEFLATRIAGSVVEAFDSLKPACVGWTTADPDEALTYNRAFTPFFANKPEPPVVAKLMADAQAHGMQGRGKPVAVKSGAEVAVDRTLRMLRIERRQSDALSCDGAQLAGVFAVYGMHPTGLPNTNELYSGDIFGFATRTAEACLATAPRQVATQMEAERLELDQCQSTDDTGSSNVVVGLANGIEGDVLPAVIDQSWQEAHRVGRALGWLITVNSRRQIAMHAAPDKSRGEDLTARYWALQLPGAAVEDGTHDRLCDEAALGAQAGGGAVNGITRLRIFPEANPGYRPAAPKGCHGSKLPVRRGAPTPYDFPATGSMAFVRIGNGIIATLPGELTTVVGLRIRDAICRSVEGCTGKNERELPVAVVGLTNSFLQYVATKEEYAFQFYEGASTLYGENSAEFFVRHAECLARAANGKPHACRHPVPIDVVPRPKFDPAPTVHRFAEDENDYEPRALVKPIWKRLFRGGAWGVETEIERLPLAFSADRDRFRVEIERETPGDRPHVVADDRGSSVEVRELDSGTTWRLRWTPDIDSSRTTDRRCTQRFRIAVRGRVSLETDWFTLGCGGPRAEVGR